ncbi:MAG: hypothetical protein NC548_33555 [Lachnospiraceae bacterium]|nr:hypothetical protein [Lachnospiraceae bacterium]MCM1232735.1 hypothetical protein [Ruminococcus flavefaciens]
MAKLSKNDLLAKIAALGDDDIYLSLLEDVTDSFIENTESVDVSSYQEQINTLNAQITDLKQRYKERFLYNATSTDSDIDVSGTNVTQSNVIDIKEI